MEDFLSRVLYFAEKGYPLPVAYKKAKEVSRSVKDSYELARRLILSYYSLSGKSYRKKVREFLQKGVHIVLPEWFERELDGIYDIEKLKDSFLDRVIWIRVNTLKADEDKVIKSLENEGIILEKDKDIPYAYKVVKGDIRSTTAFKEFKVIIQDKASMAVIEALKPEKGELIFDMASAPGIKASLIMALTDNQSELVVSDIDRERLHKEIKFLHDVGVNMDKVHIIHQDSTSSSVIKADKVLLDAPCSSTGMISNEPTVLLKLTKQRVNELSELQRNLLNKALSISSYVIYATCSLLPQEGEYIVKEFNTKSPLNFAFSNSFGNRFIPYLHQSEGFFISKVSG
ncbi:RsmB/NOP family class I SAM-dependent RNA methyltransferase [Sulfurisphaera ohwakuensis]|uniref:16S rRNA (Cytosine967-C5)-methyltransferase n=1 Tax=Sulfurisphaera ohwakuensis TaxID=69656 RepID=A0A650CJM4_SULOH|nr:RsmB/NOP family class I SAM-dependent RNA methyltransferase [Sulfurisphaera ohwakuensis]MBB5254662.1 16S rRNA (cytosine967-C5)-methyltransferase [Sulfurisphaera ohwakuensis]QGR18051.1 RsmB/NOP family class I SAM-dependent RNA methyltransferase [Sulfurisphaera ohwakuensis]